MAVLNTAFRQVISSWTSFLQNIARHLVFGLALGLLYRERR